MNKTIGFVRREEWVANVGEGGEGRVEKKLSIVLTIVSTTVSDTLPESELLPLTIFSFLLDEVHRLYQRAVLLYPLLTHKGEAGFYKPGVHSASEALEEGGGLLVVPDGQGRTQLGSVDSKHRGMVPRAATHATPCRFWLSSRPRVLLDGDAGLTRG
jgi:hypothetical protein